MAKVVKAKRRYEIMENGADTEVIVKRKSPARIWVAFMLSLGLGLAIFIALIAINKGGALPAFSMMAFLVFLWWWAFSDLTDKLKVDDRGVAKRGKLYLFEDIESLCYKNRLGTQVDLWKRQATTEAHNAASSHAYGLYILYGSKEIDLTYGLTELEAEQIYGVLRGVFGKHGCRFA